MEPLGTEVELTPKERELHGIESVLVTNGSLTVNGWVANIPRNRQLAGDVYMERRNPHYGVKGRPSADQPYSHTFTDLHNADRSVISHRARLEHETAQLRQDIALVNMVRARIGKWSSWSEAEFECYSATLELVTTGHLRDLDLAKQEALEQLIGSAKFTDSLGRQNPSMVSWRLPVTRDRLEERQVVVNKQFGTAEERHRWLDECRHYEKKKIDKILKLIEGNQSLSNCQDEFLKQARFVYFKPFVQAVNKAWHTIDQPESAVALRESLLVFCELYGALMRPMSIVASISIKAFEKFSLQEIGSFVLLVESLPNLLHLVGTDKYYQQLASQLNELVDRVSGNLVLRDFKTARNVAEKYRTTLRYHGTSQWSWANWYLRDGMEWPSTLPPDFDPFTKFDR